MVRKPVIVLACAAAVVAAWVAADSQQRAVVRQEREKARLENAERRAHELHQRARAKRELNQKRLALERLEAEAALTPEQRRHKELVRQFHPWDGSHMALEASIKARMHNPDSYQHSSTRFEDLGPGRGIKVYTTWRGTNAFGAVVLNTTVANISEAGAVLQVTQVP